MSIQQTFLAECKKRGIPAPGQRRSTIHTLQAEELWRELSPAQAHKCIFPAVPLPKEVFADGAGI